MFWGNIAARRSRSLLSIIAIAIQVILVLMMSVSFGSNFRMGKRVRSGADIWFSLPIHHSSRVLQRRNAESLGDQIEALPDVDVCAHVILTEPKI